MHNETIDVLFFERPLVDLRKFAFKIAKELKKIDTDIHIGAICIELPSEEEKKDNSVDIFWHRNQIKNIDDFLTSRDVKIVVFTQCRIPDLEFILHAKKLGIKTIMLQEGVMFDGMNINDVSTTNAVAILGYLPKVFEYLNIVRHMCSYDGKSFFKVMAQVFKKKKNITMILEEQFSVHLIAEYLLTMGEYWDEYYESHHGYTKEQIRVIGDHDLEGFTPVGKNEEAICYIANALVEDGTAKKTDLEEFLSAFGEAVDRNTKIYVKLHPRSDKSLYKLLDNHNVEYIRDGILPSVNIYIGHRSALLGRALYESDNLIIWKFPNEEFSFYEQYATAVCTNRKELLDAFRKIDISTHTNNKVKAISKVYWNNPEGSMKCAAYLINDYMRGREI